MLKKIKSIVDGNTSDVIKLKIKRKFSTKNLNLIKNNVYKDIPIVINNRNRLYHLKKLLEFLESKSLKNIIILDNQSTYIPLIEFYKSNNFNVVRLQNNLGYLSLWKNNLFKKIYNNHYVYTDPDVLPVETCPDDFLFYFRDSLLKFKDVEKIGFGLKIDDLPNTELSKKIMYNEKKFWIKKAENTNFYYASIDTTFALYKPFTFGGYWLKAMRPDSPYLARHLPWYNDRDLSEDKFYNKNILKNSSYYTSNRFKEYE